MREIKEITACFTGHRLIPQNDIEMVSESLDRIITELIGMNYRIFAAGGALGFDTLAAEAVIRLREYYHKIELQLILPCPEQTRGWKAEDVSRYEKIKALANGAIYTSDSYTKGCMFKRNRYLADMSSVCVSYLRTQKGGTAYTVKYATKKGLRIISI